MSVFLWIDRRTGNLVLGGLPLSRVNDVMRALDMMDIPNRWINAPKQVPSWNDVLAGIPVPTTARQSKSLYEPEIPPQYDNEHRDPRTREFWVRPALRRPARKKSITRKKVVKKSAKRGRRRRG